MARSLIVAPAFAVLAALPAWAEDTPAAAAWTLFATHCGAFVEAESPIEMTRAFKPHDVQSAVTSDGAIISGSASFDAGTLKNADHAVLFFGSTQIEGGTLRFCSLTIPSFDTTSLTDLPSHAQANAADLLGETFDVVGGPIANAKGLEGIAVNLSTPGFPPRLSIQSNASSSHAMLNISAILPEE